MTPEKFGQPPEAEALLKRRMSTLRAIWIVFFLYLLYQMYEPSSMIQESARHFGPEGVRLHGRSVMGICLFLLFLSWMVPRFLVKRAEKKNTSLFLAVYKGFLFRLSFLLAVGFFGMIFSTASNDIKQGLPMTLACVIGLLLNFPTTRKFNREASDLLQAQKNSNS